MTNYSKTTNFTAKDSLVSGDANKIVKGAEIDVEFDNIATASATKANIANPTFTGVVSFPDGSAGAPSITNTGDTNAGLFFSAADTLAFAADGTAQFTFANGVIAPVTDNDIDLGTSSLEFKDGYFDGTVHTDAINLNGTAITSTAAELNILDGVTSTAAELNILDGVTATAAELNYSDTGSSVGTVVASKVVTVDANKDVASFRNITLTGELDAGSLDISGDADIDGTLETDALSINGTAVTSTAAELNILDGVTSTAAELNILDGVTSTTAELNILDGVTATTAEINYVDGVTSNVQTQLNAKAPIDGATFTGTTTIPTADINGGAIDGTVIGGSTAAAGSFTTLGASGAITGTLGTAAQTNITSVGTLGALTVTGDVTVDTNTLHVDVADNRVGIGTTAPTNNLTIVDGGGSAYGADATLLLDMKRNTTNSGATNAVGLRLANNSNGFSIKYGGASDTLNISGGSGNTMATFRNDGGMTLPYQPMFDAYLTANSNHTSGVYNLSTGDSWATRANIGNHFSSGTFTAPVDGRYLFTANITANGSVGAMAYFGCEFQVNGSRRYIHWWGKGGSTSSYFAANNSAIMSLAANDIVRLASEKAQSTTIVGGAGYTSFTGMLIG